jgi:hypothetical protein
MVDFRVVRGFSYMILKCKAKMQCMGIMKKIKSVGEKFEEGIGEFLADEDNNENNK